MIFHPRAGVEQSLPLRQDTGLQLTVPKIIYSGKKSEFYFQELHKEDQGETDDTR